jgi:hypothetical protein
VFCVAGGSRDEKNSAPHKLRILLLYARDCELFMNLMTTFRQMLTEVMACEVREYVMCIEV